MLKEIGINQKRNDGSTYTVRKINNGKLSDNILIKTLVDDYLQSLYNDYINQKFIYKIDENDIIFCEMNLNGLNDIEIEKLLIDELKKNGCKVKNIEKEHYKIYPNFISSNI